MFKRHATLLFCLIIAGTVFSLYRQTTGFEFLDYDDGVYVTENQHVLPGLTFEGARWAFSNRYFSNWMPLTYLTHMLDCELFGLRPAGHHLTNNILHSINAALLFLLLYRLTGCRRRSAFAAALFALHPLRIESVAWIAERKDVLSGLLFLLTLLAYRRYTRKPGVLPYTACLLFFALGLMAKPMLVTLPCVLLLLDWWPLRRCAHGGGTLRLMREKIPFFICSAASCLVTFTVQQQGGAVRSIEQFSLAVRAANAVVAYAHYLGKMLWPVNLAVLYPHPGMPPLRHIVYAACALGALSAAAFLTRKRRPWILVGSLWYCGTLVPVIGLVQVGSQSMADRYTYIPSIGICLLASWLLGSLARAFSLKPALIAVCALGLLAALSAATHRQLQHWKNDIALFSHAVNVTENNAIAHDKLGFYLAADGQTGAAIRQYRTSLSIMPYNHTTHTNLGLALARSGRPDEAARHYRKAIKIDPQAPEPRANLGLLLLNTGHAQPAAEQFAEAARLDPRNFSTRCNLGAALLQLRRYPEAAAQLREALTIRPDAPEALNNLGSACYAMGKFDEAEALFQRSLSVQSDPDIHYQLALALMRRSKYAEAIEHLLHTLGTRPDHAEARFNLAVALLSSGKTEAAEGHFRAAIRLRPELQQAYNRLMQQIKQR